MKVSFANITHFSHLSCSTGYACTRAVTQGGAMGYWMHHTLRSALSALRGACCPLHPVMTRREPWER